MCDRRGRLASATAPATVTASTTAESAKMVTMSAVWDRTTEFLSDHGGAVATIAAATLFAPAVVDGIIAPLKPTAGTGGQLGLALISLAMSLIGVLGQLALIALALDPAIGRGGAFRLARKRFWPMIAVSVVLLIAVVVLFLPPLFLFASNGIDLDAMQQGVAPNVAPSSMLIIALYIIVLTPILFWLTARLAPIGGVVVAERLGLGAIRRAFALSRGLALKLVGVLILYAVVALVAVLAARTVIGSVARILLDGRGTLDAATVITAIAVAAVSAALTAVATVFAAKLYAACVGRAGLVPAA